MDLVGGRDAKSLVEDSLRLSLYVSGGQRQLNCGNSLFDLSTLTCDPTRSLWKTQYERCNSRCLVAFAFAFAFSYAFAFFLFLFPFSGAQNLFFWASIASRVLRMLHSRLS